MRTFIEKMKLVVKIREKRDVNGQIFLKSHLLGSQFESFCKKKSYVFSQ